MTNDKTKLRIRMYRQGLGDCFLLTFNPDEQPVHILIDCGTLGNGGSAVTMQRVVDDIASTTQRHLGLLIATHEHRDHVSGFNTGRAVFDDNFKVDQVWVAWTENPKDPLAQKIVKYKTDLLSSLRFASQKLQASGLSGAEQAALAATGTRIGALLDFEADLPQEEMALGLDVAQSVNEAMNYATGRAGRPPDYLEPGQVLEPAWLPGVRFYVLGPPCSQQALALLGDRDSPELYHFDEQQAASLAATTRYHAAAGPLSDYRRQLDGEARQSFETGLPFDDYFRIDANDQAACQDFYPSYFAEKEAWRRIDWDWLSSADDLALQLNSMTNNTSLVLAIELIADGRVILMAADAQLGNWQSWDKLTFDVAGTDSATHPVTTADLLKRTVFYKVGHHASINGTRKPGLEAMVHPDLLAMIAVNSDVAKNKHWVMPEPALYDALIHQTQGRVYRSDIGLPPDKPDDMSQADWDALKQRDNPRIEECYIDYTL